MSTQTQALQDVIAERVRQIEEEGWTHEHDDAVQNPGEMSRAGSAYSLNASNVMQIAGDGGVPDCWPWHRDWWKPTTPRRDLVKAAALLLAEIERIDRAGCFCVEDHSGPEVVTDPSSCPIHGGV